MKLSYYDSFVVKYEVFYEQADEEVDLRRFDKALVFVP